MHKRPATRRRRPSARRVKCHRSYTIDEAARVTEVCKATVRRWIKSGLPTVQTIRPYLILGDSLMEFMRKNRPHQKCQPAECFCFKCRAPRKPALGMADYIAITGIGGNLRAICEVCGTLMHKRITLAVLEQIRGELDVTVVDRNRHLEEGP